MHRTIKRNFLHKEWVDPEAHKIVNKLQSAGYTTYLVGGCVRDLLVGEMPKDFDIATKASPNEVKKRIHNAYIIGKRFRLVLAYRNNVQYEIATFRRDPKPEEINEELSHQSENFFGDPEADAKRRDFTINALFYDSVKDEIIDFVQGLQDIQDRILRTIGDANTRLIEDPIRILRALRLSHKISFQLDHDLRTAIQNNSESLKRSVLPRRREDLLKILRLANPGPCIHEAYDLGILQSIYPTISASYKTAEQQELWDHYFQNFQTLCAYKSEPSFLFGGLLYIYSKVILGDNLADIVSYWMGPESEALRIFLRDELGMFNAEQEAVRRAFELMPLMLNTEQYKRKGGRRQRALVQNPGFLLALHWLSIDHYITAQDIHFWWNEAEKWNT